MPQGENAYKFFSSRENKSAMKFSGLRILYMEDERGLARLLQKKMEKKGFVVDIARDGEQGVLKLETEHYDILIVDYNMPVMNGMEVIRTLASARRLPPTIMLTATGNEQVAVEALKWGAADYIVKNPGYLELIPSVIEQILYEQTLQRQKQMAEEALRKSEATNRALLSAIPDTMIQVDEAGNILTFNLSQSQPNFLKGDLTGKNLYELLPSPISELTRRHVMQVMKSRVPVVFEFSHGGNTVLFFENRIVPSGERNVLAIIRDITPRVLAEKEKERLINELQTALANIKKLQGLIPICASCKKIRDDKGYWNQLEIYLQEHSDAMFSHSVCPECMEKLYPEWAK